MYGQRLEADLGGQSRLAAPICRPVTRMELGGFEPDAFSVSRGAAERASPEGIVSTHTAPESEVRSAVSGESGRPVAPGRTDSPAEEARMELGGFEPPTSWVRSRRSPI